MHINLCIYATSIDAHTYTSTDNWHIKTKLILSNLFIWNVLILHKIVTISNILCAQCVRINVCSPSSTTWRCIHNTPKNIELKALVRVTKQFRGITWSCITTYCHFIAAGYDNDLCNSAYIALCLDLILYWFYVYWNINKLFLFNVF